MSMQGAGGNVMGSDGDTAGSESESDSDSDGDKDAGSEESGEDD